MWWLWIGSALLLIAGWVTLWFPGWPWMVGAGVTAFLVVVNVAVLVFRLVRARSRADSLERELLRQASQQAEHARPDRREEILALKTRMGDAIAALKRSKLGTRGGQSALYALPWYVIIGPPAAGKTTALEQSGLAFISPGGGGSKVKGTAGTKNCDWWFSKDAILLDTAGRFATEDDDQDEWFAFLDTVKKFRAERPLDGIVLAVNLAEVMSAGDAAMEDLAAKLRTRFEEVMSHLEMVLPIYVLFTKTDLVPGFIEFFSDLGKQQRGQVWGATFALDDERLAEPQAAFEEEFDLLVSSLHARMVDRLPQERVADARARVLQFPVEFRSLKSPLAHFMDELFRSNPYQETPILRGFYFTSGTQVGRPMDRVLAKMLSGFGLAAKVGRAATTQAQSYFVTDLFKTIIFPDRNVALTSSSRLRRGAKARILGAAAALFSTLVLVVPALLSYVDNLDLVHATGSQVKETLRAGGASGTAALATTLDPLLRRVQELERDQATFHVPGLWGLRTAEPLALPVRAFYVERLRSVIEGPVREQLTADVRAISDLVRTDSENFRSSYDDLKLYVMMIAPAHLNAEWAAPRLAEEWARAARGEKEADQERLRVHTRYYLDALAAAPAGAWKPDVDVLGPARDRLSQQPVEELQYRWLLSSAKGALPVRPEQIFLGSSAAYVTPRGAVEVPGAYTKAGWEKVKASLDSGESGLVLEPWVFGNETARDNDTRKASADRLRDMYFQKYVRAWSDFLGGLSVQQPTDIGTAVDEMRALSEADGPYSRLFRAIADNARLDMTPPTLAGKAAAKAKDLLAGAAGKLGADAGAVLPRTVSPVERQLQPLVKFGFGDAAPGAAAGASAPSALNQYLAQLTMLEVALGQLLASKGEPTAQFQDDLARTTVVVERLLGGLDPASRALVEPLLMNPIRGSRAGVADTASTALQDKWKAEVWETYDAKIAPRFPFAAADGDVAITEFAEFFRPQTGLIWKFVEKNLSDRLERSGNTFTPRAAAEPVPFNPEFLRCLTHSQEITDAIFGAGTEPVVPFSVKLESEGAHIAEVTLTIDGDAIVYRNEPERWFTAQWPGKGTTRGGMLQVKGAGFTDEIPRLGDFGLYRLLAAGDLKPSTQTAGGGPIFLAVFNLTRPGEPPVRVSMRPNKSAHPFARDFFRRLKCPAQILLGGRPARAAP